MAKNVLIVHDGMGYPPGAVVPPAVFPGGYAGHLSLGAVRETDLPATHATDLPAVPTTPDEAKAQNAVLRAKIAQVEAARDGAVKARVEAEALLAVAEAETKAAADQARTLAAQLESLRAGGTPAAAQASELQALLVAERAARQAAEAEVASLKAAATA